MWRQLTICFVVFFATAIPNHASAQIFTDDLSSGTNWTIVQDSDASAEFGFDYSTRGVPSAPNGSDTIGLKFEVNNSAGSANQIVAINNNAAYTGQYTFRVDAWLNWAPDGGGPGTGTTEFLGAGVGHNGTAALPLGGAFHYSSDGDSGNTDYRMFKEAEELQSESGQYAAGDMTGARNNSDPYYADAFPEIDIAAAVPTQGSSGTNAAGAGGFQWMTLNIEVDTDTIGPSGFTSDPGFARVSLRSANSGNMIEIGTIDNSNGDTFFTADLDGSIALLMADVFSSVAVNTTFSFGLFDNVQVLNGLVPLDGGGNPGDFDGSGAVDGQDFLLWQTDPNIGSLSDWQANYGTGSLASLSALPEPTSAMLALGFLALSLPSRKR